MLSAKEKDQAWRAGYAAKERASDSPEYIAEYEKGKRAYQNNRAYWASNEGQAEKIKQAAMWNKLLGGQ